MFEVKDATLHFETRAFSRPIKKYYLAPSNPIRLSYRMEIRRRAYTSLVCRAVYAQFVF